LSLVSRSEQIRAAWKVLDDSLARQLPEIMARLVGLESHSQREGCEEGVALYLKEVLADAGCEVEVREVCPGRPNVLGAIGDESAGPTVMINCHTDTVPAENWRGPTPNPYELVVRGGRMYGRGTADVKGSIAGTVLAIMALAASGTDIPGRVVFAGVTGEEGSASNGTHEVLRNGPIPDMAVVCEPTGLDIYVSQKGSANFNVAFTGLAAHSSRPDRGVNAIEAAARFIMLHLESFEEGVGKTVDPLLGPATLVPVGISGGGRADTIPDAGSVRLNCRYPPQVGLDVIESYLAGVAERACVASGPATTRPTYRVSREKRIVEWRFDDKPEFNAAPFSTPVDSPLVRVLSRSVAAVTARDPAIRGATFWSDAGLLCGTAGVPTVIFGPGEIGVAHSPVEYVETAEILDMARILVHFCLSPKP
jgi:acetylornithine deacetylase/succinyl-diaminopimelate desuccinylase